MDLIDALLQFRFVNFRIFWIKQIFWCTGCSFTARADTYKCPVINHTIRQMYQSYFSVLVTAVCHFELPLTWLILAKRPYFGSYHVTFPLYNGLEIGRASCRKECRSWWSRTHG